MKKLILFCLSLLIINTFIHAQTVIMNLKGKVTYFDDRSNLLNNAVKVDGVLSGTIVYYTNVTDHSIDTTVGDYNNTIVPAGMEIKIGSLSFKTDPAKIQLLVESVSRPSNNSGDAIVFRSYNNVFPVDSSFDNKMMSWQLDDFSGKALRNDSLIHFIDLNKFEQISGLTIQANSYKNRNQYFIRAIITEITCTVKDANNKVISTETSVLGMNNSPIKVDTTTNLVRDFDGNQYHSVKIGEQVWLRENIRSTHYSDGTTIKDVHAYNNEEINAAIYGRLYTWEASMHGSLSSILVPSGVQGVCPVGWHVPSDNEWYTLIKYLGGNSLAGAKMKEKGTDYWKIPNQGADNSSFFTVRPAGSLQSGTYYYLGYNTAFWSSSDYNASETYARYVFLTNQTTNAVLYNDGNKSSSLSVRCIKDSETDPILVPISSPDTVLIPIPIPAQDSISTPESSKDNTNVTSINQDVDHSNFEICPNPVGDDLLLRGLPLKGNVCIMDITGKIVVNQLVVSNSINVGNLKKGIYVIKFMNQKEIIIRKFMKQ